MVEINVFLCQPAAGANFLVFLLVLSKICIFEIFCFQLKLKRILSEGGSKTLQHTMFWLCINPAVLQHHYQCFFICFKKYSTPKFFAPFGDDFGDFGPVLNQNSFEIHHFCAPQAKFFNILRLKNDFSFIFRCIF